MEHLNWMLLLKNVNQKEYWIKSLRICGLAWSICNLEKIDQETWVSISLSPGATSVYRSPSSLE